MYLFIFTPMKKLTHMCLPLHHSALFENPATTSRRPQVFVSHLKQHIITISPIINYYNLKNYNKKILTMSVENRLATKRLNIAETKVIKLKYECTISNL